MSFRSSDQKSDPFDRARAPALRRRGKRGGKRERKEGGEEKTSREKSVAVSRRGRKKKRRAKERKTLSLPRREINKQPCASEKNRILRTSKRKVGERGVARASRSKRCFSIFVCRFASFSLGSSLACALFSLFAPPRSSKKRPLLSTGEDGRRASV